MKKSNDQRREWENEATLEEQQYFRLHKFKKRLEHTWGPEAIEAFLKILDEARAEDFWVAEKPRVQIKLEQLLSNMDKGDVPHIIDQYHKLQAEDQQHGDRMHSPEAFAENENENEDEDEDWPPIGSRNEDEDGYYDCAQDYDCGCYYCTRDIEDLR